MSDNKLGDKELEAVCDREIERIKAEIRAAQGPVEVQVNVGDNQRNSGSKLNPGTVQINIGRNQRNCMGDFYE